MPEVKWISEWYDTQADAPVERIGVVDTVPVPVLTLDDIEAWLGGHRLPGLGTHYVDGSNDLLSTLLAQVRAMKGSK